MVYWWFGAQMFGFRRDPFMKWIKIRSTYSKYPDWIPKPPGPQTTKHQTTLLNWRLRRLCRGVPPLHQAGGFLPENVFKQREYARGSFDPFCLVIMQFLRYLAAVCLASVTSLSLQGCSSETSTETTAETATVTMTTTMTMTMTTTMTSTVTTVASRWAATLISRWECLNCPYPNQQPDFWTINSRFPVEASRKYFEIFAWCLHGKPTVDGSEIWHQ